MSRAVVLDAIIGDPVLSAIGFDEDSVVPNYDAEQRPNDEMFIVLRWGTDEVMLSAEGSQVKLGPRNVDAWVHMYREMSSDFNKIDAVIDRLDVVLSNIIDVPGSDGRTVSQIIAKGRSRDLKDDGYVTYCRSASYQVFSRVT